MGVIPTHEALALAKEAGLDLVEVSPNENPPVCRIIDYGKHIYEKKKRQKQAAAAHVTLLKEIRLRPKTDVHDRGIKLKHAREFLAEGHKVQFTMLFRGRERFHREIANEIFDDIIKELGEAAKLERGAAMDGKRLTMIVSPGKKPSGGGSSQKSQDGKPTAKPLGGKPSGGESPQAASPPSRPPAEPTPARGGLEPSPADRSQSS